MNNGEFSGARLGRMRDVMAGHVKHGDVPGIVTLVSRRGEVHVDAIGTKAFGCSESMRRDTIFRIASVTCRWCTSRARGGSTTAAPTSWAY